MVFLAEGEAGFVEVLQEGHDDAPGGVEVLANLGGGRFSLGSEVGG